MKIVNTSNNPIPKYETKGSAGFDLASNEDISIAAFGRGIVDTGIYVALREGYELQIRPRSGMAAKHGITVLNSPGTIDSDYRGRVKVILYNTTADIYEIAKGDRIAQGVVAQVVQVEFEEVATLDETERGADGFGSTGK